MSAVHLFIDTSTFLTFYAFTSDDLEELKKTVGLIKAGKLKLYIPAQVVDEFYRNREAKLLKSFADFEGGGEAKAIPRFMADYEEAEDFKDALLTVQKARSALATKAKSDASKKLLPADTVFEQIVEAAGVIATTDKLLQEAQKRRLLGNPPGKHDSMGDQLNWESLLECVADGADLHVVTNDGDYRSVLDSSSPNPFIEAEWTRRKSASLRVHKELRLFLNANFPNIHLAADIEKNIAKEALIYSGSFQDTHKATASLKGHLHSLKWPDVREIFEAGLANNQIQWIGTDDDVNEFYRTRMAIYSTKLTPELAEQLETSFPEPVDDDVPF